MANKIFVTEEGLKKLQGELQGLKDVKRVEIAQKLKEAISFGDLSENSEYEDARNEQSAVEMRILELEEQLKNIEIIKEKNEKTDRVIMGATVTIENLQSKEQEVYKIVGSAESDVLGKVAMVSNESPFGKAILGKNKGDTFILKAPSGEFQYGIIDVK